MTSEFESTEPRVESTDNGTLYLGLGLGLGGYVTATSLLLGFACPVCTIAAPALIATGAYQKLRARRAKAVSDAAAEGDLAAQQVITYDAKA